MDENAAKREIIETARAMLAKGLVQGTGGNFSVRCARGMIITPSGMDYGALTPDDLPVLSLGGEMVEGFRKPSVERELHAEIYRRRPDVNAVIHTHSVYATAAAALRAPMPVLTDNQAVLFGGAVPCAEYAPIGTEKLAPCAEYAPIGTEKLARSAAQALGPGCGVLLANHGALCACASLAEAALKCEMLEIFAKIYFLTALRGGGVPLTAEEIKNESEDMSRRYGQS